MAIKKFWILVLAIVFAAGIYWGTLDRLVKQADAEEEIKPFTVYKMKYDEHGYTPLGEFSMSKSTLEAHVKICWFEASMLDSGAMLISFDVGKNERWLVKISDSEVMRELKKIENIYGLKCSIPI